MRKITIHWIDAAIPATSIQGDFEVKHYANGMVGLISESTGQGAYYRVTAISTIMVEDTDDEEGKADIQE